MANNPQYAIDEKFRQFLLDMDVDFFLIRKYYRLNPAQKEMVRFGVNRHAKAYERVTGIKGVDRSAITEIIKDAESDISIAYENHRDATETELPSSLTGLFSPTRFRSRRKNGGASSTAK